MAVQTSLKSTPSGPYAHPEEQRFFKYFIEVAAASVARSGLSASFWLLSYPQAAWSEPTVRDALLALATSFEIVAKGVRNQQPIRRSQLLAIGYENRAMRTIVQQTPSIECIIIMAMGLWMQTMLVGHWSKTLQHGYYALKIISSIKDRSKYDLLVLKYTETLASSALNYFRDTRGPCPFHPGGDILTCEASCYQPEEASLEMRVADTVHHLRALIPLVLACKDTLEDFLLVEP